MAAAARCYATAAVVGCCPLAPASGGLGGLQAMQRHSSHGVRSAEGVAVSVKLGGGEG